MNWPYSSNCPPQLSQGTLVRFRKIARRVLAVFITVGNPVVARILSQGMFHVSCDFGRSKVLLHTKRLVDSRQKFGW